MLRLALALAVLASPPAWGDAVSIVSVESGDDRLAIAAGDILDIQVQTDFGRPRVVVTLGPGQVAALARFTADHLSQEVVLTVCGQVVSRPTLIAPVLDGIFAIMGDSRAKADHLAQILRTNACQDMPVT